LTLHSALLLHGMFSSKLSADRLNTLRNCLGKLVVLVIDEISMVGAEMLLEVDRRLREIKSTDRLFGGVSMLAVGDLHQLPPVKQKPVFAVSRSPRMALYGSPWHDYVEMIELTENMRQRDQQFSEILGRIRIGEQTEDDVSVLSTRLIVVNRESPLYPIEVLHIFATNKQCDEHNLYCLSKLQTPVYRVAAVDSKHDRITTSVNVNNLNLKPSETGGLRQTLTLAVGARVMLVANVNVSDGLSNGVIGSIRGVIQKNGQVKSVQVQFDNAAVGKLARTENPFRRQHPGCVDVQRHSVNYTYGRGKSVEVTRSQFPLSLAFACTIHKIQGMTLDNVVISMKSRFGPGQAYVAISRVRTMEGLHFVDFDPKKIVVSEEVVNEMNRLRGKPSTLPDLIELPSATNGNYFIRNIQYMQSFGQSYC
jgi:ATP-dependent exoDNAse (exonuclease V) alpha subunit